jgi:hypothetical protein
MSTEPTVPPQPAGWGDPPPAAEPGAKKGWSGRKTAVAAGVAVLIAAGGGVAIAVGTSGNTTAQQPAMGGLGGGRQFGGPQGGGASAVLNALHGDFVMPDGKGGYTTERLQTGDVTEVSATSISVSSKDGYKQVYTIDPSTQKTGEPKTGQSVTVVAKISGDTATVTTVGPATALPQRGGGTGQLPGGQRPGN